MTALSLPKTIMEENNLARLSKAWNGRWNVIRNGIYMYHSPPKGNLVGPSHSPLLPE